MAVQKSSRNTLHSGRPNASTALAVPEITGCTSTPRGTLRYRAFLPENISKLSKCQFKRQDHQCQPLPPTCSVPAPAPCSGTGSSSVSTGQEGQVPHSLVLSDAVFRAYLVAKNTALPFDSVSSIGEMLIRGEICPHILGVQAWSKQPSHEAGQ